MWYSRKCSIIKCSNLANIECHRRNKIEDIKCNEICQITLNCGHTCVNKCCECKQHICKQNCGKVLSCGHKCCLPCGVPCYTCYSKCVIKCPHAECKRKCFEICEPCKMPCSWSCKHNNLKCTKQCYENCNPPRCDQKCDKILKCGHICQSLCGEECLCLDCVSDIKLDKSKIYVRLYNCHCLIEVEILDKYMENEAVRIKDIQGFPKCPSCGWFI